MNRNTKSKTELAEETLRNLDGWRAAHPKATLREIEQEVDEQLAVLRAKLVEELALASDLRDWKGSEVRPRCPECGVELEAREEEERRLQSLYGQEVVLKRRRGVCPQCGAGIFPPG